jgi:hypothetical protein
LVEQQLIAVIVRGMKKVAVGEATAKCCDFAAQEAIAIISPLCHTKVNRHHRAAAYTSQNISTHHQYNRHRTVVITQLTQHINTTYIVQHIQRCGIEITVQSSNVHVLPRDDGHKQYESSPVRGVAEKIRPNLW